MSYNRVLDVACLDGYAHPKTLAAQADCRGDVAGGLALGAG